MEQDGVFRLQGSLPRERKECVVLLYSHRACGVRFSSPFAFIWFPNGSSRLLMFPPSTKGLKEKPCSFFGDKKKKKTNSGNCLSPGLELTVMARGAERGAGKDEPPVPKEQSSSRPGCPSDPGPACPCPGARRRGATAAAFGNRGVPREAYNLPTPECCCGRGWNADPGCLEGLGCASQPAK